MVGGVEEGPEPNSQLQDGVNALGIVQGPSSLPISSFHQSVYWGVEYKTNKGPEISSDIPNH